MLSLLALCAPPGTVRTSDPGETVIVPEAKHCNSSEGSGLHTRVDNVDSERGEGEPIISWVSALDLDELDLLGPFRTLCLVRS